MPGLLLSAEKMPRRLTFALDLRDDPDLIEAYLAHHRAVWPEVLASIRQSGVLDMEIYCCGNRLFMIMEVDESFDDDAKAAADAANPRVQAWEELMWAYQQALPWAHPGQKWVPMERIFALGN